ncbi:MAG: hypothetical protein F6J98_40110 [Moorea sp. SIO4G2]|nr:hypothetical protein [Moorena sp. SIO4G2]
MSDTHTAGLEEAPAQSTPTPALNISDTVRNAYAFQYPTRLRFVLRSRGFRIFFY